MSNILKDGRFLLVNTKVASIIGVNEAIVLQQVHYWLDKIETSTDDYFRETHTHDGRFWVYNTYAEWNKQFPFWNLSTVKRIFNRLEDKKILISNCYNKHGYDRTKWYSIDYDVLQTLILQESAKLHQSIVSTCTKASAQNDTTYTIDYTDNTTNTTKDNNIEFFGAKNKQVFSWESEEVYQHYLNNVVSTFLADISSDDDLPLYKNMVIAYFNAYYVKVGRYHPWYKKDTLEEVVLNIQRHFDFTVDYEELFGYIELFFQHDNMNGYEMAVFSSPNMLKWLEAELLQDYNRLYRDYWRDGLKET